MNKSKGFTLVELAVVLVVIGFLILTAAKILDIYEIARYKRDFSNTLFTIKNAIDVYYIKYGRFPADYESKGAVNLNQNVAMYEVLTKKLVLEPELLYGRPRWVFVGCTIDDSDGTVQIYATVPENLYNKVRFCATRGDYHTGTFLNAYRHAAAYELFFDDSDVRTGSGRNPFADVTSDETRKMKRLLKFGTEDEVAADQLPTKDIYSIILW